MVSQRMRLSKASITPTNNSIGRGNEEASGMASVETKAEGVWDGGGVHLVTNGPRAEEACCCRDLRIEILLQDLSVRAHEIARR